jgi:hypothetical protein
MEFWKKDIANIEFDLQSRDEIPKLLMGLPPDGAAIHLSYSAHTRESFQSPQTNSAETKP